MRRFRGFFHLLFADFKMYVREPAATFFTLLFPALLLTVSGYSFGKDIAYTTPSGVDMRILDLMVPATLAWVMATQGLMSLYPVLTSMREMHILKYYRTHPIRARHILLSQYFNGLLLFTVALALLLGVDAALFGVRYDGDARIIALAVLVSYTTFFTLGFALAGLTPSVRLAQALGSLLFFPMMFLSGTFGPRDTFPPFLKFLSDLSPLTHATDLLTDFWVSGRVPVHDLFTIALHSFRGTPFLGRTWFAHVTAAQSLAYLLLIAVVAAFVGVRAFRWDTESSSRKWYPDTSVTPPEDAIVWVHNLRKSYGDVRAVDGISFHVRRAEIFGILGPNGAGKTTTLEIVEGLRVPDGGNVRVLGLLPHRDADVLVRRVGIQLQEAELPRRLKVRELFALFAAWYEHTLPIDEVIETLELQEQAQTFFGKLSGGQKQRVFAGLALINDPDLIFLDEITTGLDAHIRRRIWAFLRELRHRGKTIILTTHYLEEAQALCDRVIMLDRGRVVAEGAPEILIHQLGMGFRLEVDLPDNTTVSEEILQSLPGVSRWLWENSTLTLYLREPADIEHVLRALRVHRVKYRGLKAQPATLEDVFLVLTGRENTGMIGPNSGSHSHIHQ